LHVRTYVATKLLSVILVCSPLLFLPLAIRHSESPAAQVVELVAERELIQLMACGLAEMHHTIRKRELFDFKKYM